MTFWRSSAATGRAARAVESTRAAETRSSCGCRPTTSGIIVLICWRLVSSSMSLTQRAKVDRTGCVHDGWSLQRSPARKEAISMKQAPLRGVR